jgi:hypothetical protein
VKQNGLGLQSGRLLDWEMLELSSAMLSTRLDIAVWRSAKADCLSGLEKPHNHSLNRRSGLIADCPARRGASQSSTVIAEDSHCKSISASRVMVAQPGWHSNLARRETFSMYCDLAMVRLWAHWIMWTRRLWGSIFTICDQGIKSIEIFRPGVSIRSHESTGS